MLPPLRLIKLLVLHGLALIGLLLSFETTTFAQRPTTFFFF